MDATVGNSLERGTNSNGSENLNICDSDLDSSVMETNNAQNNIILETDGRETLFDTSYTTEEINDVLFEAGYSMEEIKEIVASRSSEMDTSLNSEKNSEKNDVILTDELHEEDTDFEDKNENANNFIRNIKIKNVNRIVIASLNINSVSGKFDQLKEIIGTNIDILTIQETKLDSSFPPQQFIIQGYSEPYRLDRNREGGGVMIYVREDIK